MAWVNHKCFSDFISSKDYWYHEKPKGWHLRLNQLQWEAGVYKFAHHWEEKNPKLVGHQWMVLHGIQWQNSRNKKLGRKLDRKNMKYYFSANMMDGWNKLGEETVCQLYTDFWNAAGWWRKSKRWDLIIVRHFPFCTNR